MKQLIYGCLIILLHGCGGDGLPKYEDYNEDDFIPVQGIVYKVTRTPIAPGWIQYAKQNAYYIYNLDSEHPKLGKEMNVPMLVEEGGPQVILVHKDDANISFVGRGRIIDRYVLETYLKKSKEYGIQYFGIEEE